MNVLIVSSNRNKQPLPVMPIGACIAAETAEKAGHKATLLDLMFAEDVPRQIEQVLAQTQPDVVGMSVRNVDNNDIKAPLFFVDETAQWVKLIRKISKAVIVLGGAAVQLMPEQFLRYTNASVAVLGKEESVFPELLRALEQGKDYKNVPGIARLENNAFMKNPLPTEQKQSSSNFLGPDFHRWIDVKAYSALSSAVPVQTKRGCPFNCVYCTYAVSEGRHYELCGPEAVVNYINKLVSTGIRDIEFVDNVFNAPYEHAMEICGRLAGENRGARLQTMELNPKFVDDALLTAMEKAGFVGIGVTAESADDAVLKGLGKDYSAQDVLRVAEVINRHKLPCFWIFLLGGPNETPETVQRTLDFAATYIRPSDTAFFNMGVRIYPGTELEKIARREGVLEISSEEMLKPLFYLSPRVDKHWLCTTVTRAIKAHMNFIDPESFTLPLLSTILRCASSLGMQQPVWKHTRTLRHALRFLGSYS